MLLLSGGGASSLARSQALAQLHAAMSPAPSGNTRAISPARGVPTNPSPAGSGGFPFVGVAPVPFVGLAAPPAPAVPLAAPVGHVVPAAHTHPLPPALPAHLSARPLMERPSGGMATCAIPPSGGSATSPFPNDARLSMASTVMMGGSGGVLSGGQPLSGGAPQQNMRGLAALAHIGSPAELFASLAKSPAGVPLSSKPVNQQQVNQQFASLLTF